MRDIMLAIFQSPKVENGMGWLSGWHLLYLVGLIVLSIVVAVLLKKKATVTARDRVLRVLAYAVPALYIADFFIMPLSTPSHGIEVMKLPFHICTFLSFFIPLAQFNHHFRKVRDVIAAVTLVCATLYLVYPGTALEYYTPYSYLAIQTFLYHGAMFAWAWISIANDAVTLQLKNLWKAAVAVVIAQLWATFGNTVYSYEGREFDWFMMTGRSVPFLPTWFVPIGVFGVVFGSTAIVYAVTYIVKKKKRT